MLYLCTWSSQQWSCQKKLSCSVSEDKQQFLNHFSGGNKDKHLRWAKKYQNFTVDDEKSLFTDEFHPNDRSPTFTCVTVSDFTD